MVLSTIAAQLIQLLKRVIMPSIKNMTSPFVRHLWLTGITVLLFILSFIAYVHAEKEIDYANEKRLRSFILADELRQSSDDLTRMVRTYIATGNLLYKEHYQEILDIRNGTKPRPSEYQNIYWDLVGLDDKRPQSDISKTSALIDRMKNSGFTQQEFAKLSEAKNNSDALTETEFAAMKLIETPTPSTHEKELLRSKALELLHDEAYHNAKASIMRPISEFNHLMNSRTALAVKQAEMNAFYCRFIFILMGLLVFFMLWRFNRMLSMLLGGSIDEVHTQISRLGKGDFSHPIVIQSTLKNSILAWLAETQTTLQHLMSSNERLKNIYSALSQCNQAIIRSSNEDELFPIICRDAIRFGGMQMAWIGIADETSQEIKAVSYYGEGTDYLTNLHISTNPDDPSAHGPTGLAFHQNQSIWCQDFQHDPRTALWHERGKRFGWESSAAIPLSRGNKVIGVFTLYAKEVNAFDEAAQHLLEEMAMDISYALDSFDKESARIKGEERIEYLANFDSLTGLPNRTQLAFRINELLNVAKRHHQYIAVMFLDLDHFKDINDTLGHTIGDLLLIEAANRVRSLLREEDTVTRLGGDEFIILLPTTNTEGAAQVAQKLLEIFQKPFHIQNNELNISASIGISLYPSDGADFETLYKNADTAMYRAKHNGRNIFCFFTEDMQRQTARNLALGNALRHAIERGELYLEYQPQFSLIDRTIIGAEALLRWNHPEFGNVSPAEFIPIAEETGTIMKIGEWVLRTALTMTKTWMDQGYAPIIMAVNLSAVQFRSQNLPANVTTILNEIGISPEYLELELTESIAMHDPQRAIIMMNDLHNQGIRMSIDDFGTGYSSLSYLKKFNIYKLKIDQSFVRDIDIDPEDKAIVSAIINMSKSLGLLTIAEGVETIEQLNYLQEQGCDEIQGYYLSKPLPKEAFEALRQKH